MSGADLIGEVPPHWSVKPLRLIGRLLKGTGGSKEDVVEIGVPCVRYGDLYTTHNNFIERARTYLTEDRAQDYTPIEYGDVLFAASGETIEEIGKSAVNLLHDARCGGDVVIFRPNKPSIARFFGYAMDAAPVAAQKSLAGRGTTVKHIYPDELREVVIAVPPVGEQQVIADYLDRETARLDALVAAKERVLGLLAEKRRALITRAVTRGLDPSAPLRDSGIPWLGEIPAHWKVVRLKFLSTGPLAYGANESASEDDPSYPRFVRITDIHEDGNLREETFRSLPHETAAPYLLEDGDILFARSGATVGKAFLYKSSWGAACFAGYLIRLRCNTRLVQAEFVNDYAQTEVYWGQIREGTIQATIQNFSAEKYGDLAVAVPPIEDQQRIIAHILRETARLDSIRSSTERTIALLRERRAALIAAAVTGQLDVA